MREQIPSDGEEEDGVPPGVGVGPFRPTGPGHDWSLWCHTWAPLNNGPHNRPALSSMFQNKVAF